MQVHMQTKQFDYNGDQMDEHVSLLPIPVTNPHSLNSSRRRDNCSSHRQVLADLENFIMASKQKEEQRVVEMKKRQRNIGEQITKRQVMKSQKIKLLQKQQKERMLKQCTFQPKLITKEKKKRNFNEFLESQNAYTQKIKEKKDKIKRQVEEKKEKATYHPKINSSSNQKKHGNGPPIYERLYALREKQNNEEQSQVKNNNSNEFHPRINARSKNMLRSGPIEELLYSDALRRQQKGHQILITSTSNGSKLEKAPNFNNEKYAAQKFIREFFFTLEDLKIDPSLSFTVEYMVFDELLKQMGFMTNEEEYESKSSSVERTLLNDAYEIIGKYQVNARNICVFLLALLGIYHINPVNFEQGEEPDEAKELNFDEIQGRKIQRHFDLLYRNRLSSEVSRKNEQRSEQYSFQPKINKQSAQLAERHRNGMLQEANQLIQQYPEIDFAIPEDGVISHTDLLVLHKMAKDIEKERIKYERDEQKLKQCTFKPNTFASSLSNSKLSENYGLTGYKKSHELYDYYKNLQNKKQSMRVSRSEIDPQCTFKPQINKNRIPIQTPQQSSKQTDETLYRLFKGRQEYEQKKKFLERGEPTSKQRHESMNSQQQQQVPSLILDVNLGEKMDRIVLYKGDENRLGEVAKQFAMKHGIDEESEMKLLEMLETEMENILSKIEQDEESEEQIDN